MTDEWPGGYSLEEILADDELLDAYERVVPGSRDRFRGMAEREAAHREWMGVQEMQAFRLNQRFNRVLGVLAGFGVSVAVGLVLRTVF